LNRSMGVGLEGLLLTRLPSSFTWVDVPYSGDNELGATWSDPRMRAGTSGSRVSDGGVVDGARGVPWPSLGMSGTVGAVGSEECVG
jgi:hypothetical protein